MRGKFSLTWRIAVTLLLALALVPALVMGVAVAETGAPTLLSISWLDGGGPANGVIDGGDTLIFNFDESMNTASLSDMSEVNARLDSTATDETWDYGTN
ncbi:MAG: hypothetical protein U9N44_04385, partial [Chloroflexota bacterium]|nr:hypothetical protein [Chloroflexota bacterium]